MIDQYKTKGYPLHVLVNNAAIKAPKGHPGEHTKDNIEVGCTIPGHIYPGARKVHTFWT